MAKEDRLEQAYKNGFASYPNARVDYPTDPQEELQWIKGWQDGRRIMQSQQHNVYAAYVNEKENIR